MISQSNQYNPRIYDVHVPKHLKIFPLRWIWKKVHQKKEDCIIVICGGTGKGKTTFASAAAELLDCTFDGKKKFPYFTKDFNAKEFDLVNPSDSMDLNNFDKVLPRFCYGANQVRQYWDWLKKRKKDGNRTTGIVGVVDEVQTLWSSREFYTSKNREAIVHFVTGRYLQTIHFLIGPEYNAIDKQILRRAHLVIQVLDKGYDKVHNKAYIDFIAQVPVFLDPRKPPILRYFRDINGTILDKPWRIGMPSNRLHSFVEAKELFWKNADKDELGNIIDPSKPKVETMDSNQKKANRIQELAISNRSNRHQFLHQWKGKNRYSAKKISVNLQLPVTWGDFLVPYFERWDKEEKINIDEMLVQSD